jgi:hypothetical protein
MDHENYSDDYLQEILSEVKVIAVVGASSDISRPSYTTFKALRDVGYKMIPINPDEAVPEILGQRTYTSLAQVNEPIDMVQVFRASDAAVDIARDAIDVGAKVLWMQLGVRDDEAAKIAEDAGLKVVMNRCPKIELFRPYWKDKLNPSF